MKMQQLYSLARQAIDRYQMIQQGDHIAVGISGGKDSLALLYALHGLRRFYPNPYTLSAISVDLGYEGFDLSPVKDLCLQLDVPYTVVSTSIKDIIIKKRQEANPCALCSRLRKGALNQAAISLGCNKIAYAHHRDDMVETMLLSLIYGGRFYSFPPVTALERTGLTVIRPLMLIPEIDIIGFQHKYRLPVCESPCPVAGHTRREYVKSLLRQLEKDNPGVKARLFHAVLTGNIPDWPSPHLSSGI